MLHYYDKLQRELSETRIKSVKETLATLVDASVNDPIKLHYKGKPYTLNTHHTYGGNAKAIHWNNRVSNLMIVDDHPHIAAELDKLILVEKQMQDFKILAIKASIEITSSVEEFQYLIGVYAGSNLVNERKELLDNYLSVKPDLRKMYRKLKLISGG